MSGRWMSNTSGFVYRRGSRFAEADDSRIGSAGGDRQYRGSSVSCVTHRAIACAGRLVAQRLVDGLGDEGSVVVDLRDAGRGDRQAP